MLNLLLEESMEAYDPSHEEIMASNVLAFLSSSGLNSASLPLQKSKELTSWELDRARFLFQERKSSHDDSKTQSRSSSDSMQSLRNSIKRDFFMGVDAMSHNFSDLDDDGLHGDRMKPLSSVENNCEMRARFLIPQFSKRRGSNSPANSKVLAAARVGRRARCKAIYYSDNKENLITTHMKDVQATCLKLKGVKRKSAGHEVNARFLALKRKRSTLSSWRTTSVPTITPFVSNVAATASISISTEVQHLTRSPPRTALKAAHTLLGMPKDAEYIQGKEIACEAQIVAPPCSTFACLQSSVFPLTESREESSCSSRSDPARKELLSFTKGYNSMGNLCTKPPTYPKPNQSILSIHNQKCSSHVVDASYGEETGVLEIRDPACMNAAQYSTTKVMEMQCGHAKVEECSEDLVGLERPFHLAGRMNMDDASCSVSYFMESLAGTESCNPQMEMCKLKVSDPTQVPAGPSLLMPSNNNSPRLQADKVLLLAQPQCFENAPTVSDSAAVVEFTKVKQETSSQNSAEMSLDSQIVNLNSEQLPRDLSTTTREHIKDSARKTPLVLQNALEHPSQLGIPKPKDHTRAWGIPLYQHNTVLPKLRRGRPPKKSNLCPCPEPKEQADKFARICAPSGVLGKLNPGIITRLRDKKQVHAVLEAVVRGAFMTGMKENLKLQGAEHADAYKGLHGAQKDNAAECRERSIMKGRETLSENECDLKLGSLDQKPIIASYLRGENGRQKHPPNGQIISSGKQEQCLLEECAVPDVRLSQASFVSISKTHPIDTIMGIRGASKVNQNNVCSDEPSGDQKVLHYNISNAATTAENAKGNVASCWLELLRLDIKGRLSALKRSRRRVRGVIVSGQLDAGGKTNQLDEMEKWRAFFVHMENVLGSEGTRLENWLNQITQMQLLYCQKKSGASDMPQKSGMDLFDVEVDGACR